MKPLTFMDCGQCRDCVLCESATRPGISSRPFQVTGKDHALVVVGEAPGYNEDQQHTCWVGQTGQLLQKFLIASKLGDYTDIYLSNAIRCRPPQNATPILTHINACRPNLFDDLMTLAMHYPKITFLALGKTATQSLAGLSSLKEAFSHQSHVLSSFPRGLLSGKQVQAICAQMGLERIPPQISEARVFFSYHPAMLLPNRKPALLPAVADHFSLLKRVVSGEQIPFAITVTPKVGTPAPAALPPVNAICLDIETYGILKGKQQTVFHPVKSAHIDKVPLGEQVVTVSIGYETGPDSWETHLYQWDVPQHRSHIRQWLRLVAATKGKVALLGQNVKFDVLYLKANDTQINQILTPLSIRLDDTLLASFLLFEQRPEKGLKELAKLFGLTDYSLLEMTAKTGTAKSSADPSLHLYNCMDVATTLALYRFCWDQIRKKFGDRSPKLTPLCTRMRNEILWDVISLEQAGVCFNRYQVQQLHRKHEALCRQAYDEGLEQGVLFSNKYGQTGSKASTLEFVTKALLATGLRDDPRVKLTDVKQEISTGIDNLHLLDSVLSPTLHPDLYAVNRALQTFSSSAKILDSYTSNLLTKPRKGIVTCSTAYPSWYPIPLNIGKSSSSTDGGTIQGRFAAKDPAIQTYPEAVKHTACSRFTGGKLIGYDLSQIELRMGAFLSGDPVMLQEYQRGIDRHTETALLVFPDKDPQGPDFRKLYRQAGKTLNFLVLYRGGAKKFRETVMKDLGIDIPEHECQAAINRFDRKYPEFRAWQDELIRTAKRLGYIELPTGWSRSFSMGLSAEAYINEICNFPIQTISAQLMQSAEYAIHCELLRRRLRSRLGLQIHDALYMDTCPGEETIVDEIMGKYLTRPPLMPILENIYGRTVPLLYEKEAA